MSEQILKQILSEMKSMNNDIREIKAEQIAMNAEIQSIKAEQATMNTEIQSIKAEQVAINTEIQSIKAEQTSINAEIREIKAEQTMMNSEIQSIKSQMNSRFDTLETQTGHIQKDVKELKASVKRLEESEPQNILAILKNIKSELNNKTSGLDVLNRRLFRVEAKLEQASN